MKPAEQYILQASEPYRNILLQLQLIIESTVPSAILLYKWRIPYYYLNGKKPLVYLYQTKDYVDVGFAKGYQLKKFQDVLIGEHRNTIKSLRFFSEKDIDEHILRELLMEACTLY